MLVYKGTASLYQHDYTFELQRLLKDESYDFLSSNHSHFSYRLEKLLHSSGVGDILEMINCLLTIIVIFFYIIGTYTYPETTQSHKTINKRINTIEIIICSILIAHFVLKFYISQSKMIFLLDTFCFIDYCTITFILIAQQSFISENLAYFFRLFRMIRILYLWKLEYIFQRRYNEAVRYFYKFSVNTLSLVFLSSSLILEIENFNYRKTSKNNSGTSSGGGKPGEGWNMLQFHDMIYFELITLTTVGFGDITPKHWITKTIVVITFCGLVAFILPVYSKLETVLALSSIYSRISYKKNKYKTQHLVVFGECGVESFKAFLDELYDEDHGNTNYNTIIMQGYPNESIMKLIQSLPYGNKIYYLVGNCLSHKDLKRCQAHHSICGVILANKGAKNPTAEDFTNIMKAFSFKKFNVIKKREDSRICMQLLRPETKRLYFSSLIRDSEMKGGDQISCVEEIKMQLLGKSCLCPGIMTIISCLITSKKPATSDNFEDMDTERYWLEEYLSGIQLEIYVIVLKAELIHNMKFIDLARLLYEIAGLTAIGIDIIIDDIPPFVCLNPALYLLAPFDHLVYVLADYQPDEEKLNEKIRDYLETNQQGIVESNKEFVKLLRMKNPYWNDSSFNPEERRRFGNKNMNKDKDNQEKNDQKDIFENIRHKPFTKYNASKLNSENSSSYKLLYDLYNNVKDNFLQSAIPRTQSEAEKFSPLILTNHIIICGVSPNMKYLLMPLRSSVMKHQQSPIIIIDKLEHISSEIWKEIQYFPDIYYMQGSPIKSKDLHKAGIKKAKGIIILSKSSSDPTMTDMIDADTIFIYKAIRNETKSSVIVAELSSIGSISFLNSREDDSYVRKHGFWLSESFSMGEIYISSMLDTLICQAFYNPYITDILEQLIMGSAGNSIPFKVSHKLKDKKIEQSTLFLFSLSEELNRLGYSDSPKRVEYQHIFKIFAKHNMIPLGILRHKTKVELANSPIGKKFVYLCPKKNIMIDIDTDKIYVLASEDYIKKEKMNQKMLDHYSSYYEFTKTSKLLDKTNELALETIERMKKIIRMADYNLTRHLGPKRVVNAVRSSFRNELAVLHDKLASGNLDDESTTKKNDDKSLEITQQEDSEKSGEEEI